MIKKHLKYLFFLSLVLTLLLTGCKGKATQSEVRRNFDDFITELFITEVKSDTLSLNYSLSNPSTYGITNDDITLGSYSIAKMNESLVKSENHLNFLRSLSLDDLSEEQFLTLSILEQYLSLDVLFGDFLHYNESLGPTTGIQAQLPILLAEYNFYSKKDIDNYIALLACVYPYFEDIIKFEIEKADMGLFMNDDVVDSIIAQCNSFTLDPENNFLIDHFNDKINNYEGLTVEEIEFYKKENKKAILDYIIPAYELLTKTLSELKGSGTNDSGLYHFPDGKAYYETLVKYKTGSGKDMSEIIRMLEQTITNRTSNIRDIVAQDNDILDKFISFTSFPITDPEEILLDLKDNIVHDFPPLIPVNCEIKYVPESLEEHLSPAMYLVPAMDNYMDNSIYINGNDADTLSSIYTTVAHEGYPGHLYQNVYFRSQNPNPIRMIMNFSGYTEGWATYVELYSYHMSGIDESLATFLEDNNLIVLCMYARADIGIHYEGWSKEETLSYISNFGGNEEIGALIYKTLLEEPGIYLPYAVGCLEILELRERAETVLSNNFDPKKFHEFLLKLGPAQFYIIEDYFIDWLNEQK